MDESKHSLDFKRGDKVTVEAVFSKEMGAVSEIFFEGASVLVPTYKLRRMVERSR